MRITIDLSDADLVALKHDLADPEAWIRDAVAGKVAACRGRMVEQAVAVLMADPAVETIPAQPAALADALTRRPGYEDRAARDRAARRTATR